MNNSQQINLEKLINNSDDYIDNTEKIRTLKHSDHIKVNVNKLIKIRENTEVQSSFFWMNVRKNVTFYLQIILKFSTRL